MKIDLDDLNLAEIVERSVANTLSKSLGATLPQVVEKMLSSSTSGSNILRESFKLAVQDEVAKNIKQFIEDRAPDIRRMVRQALELQFSPDSIAAQVVDSLANVAVSVKVFSKKKSVSLDEDIEDL